MRNMAWMSASAKLFDLISQLLQKFLDAQRELANVKQELERIQLKLARLEEEYGYDTVR